MAEPTLRFRIDFAGGPCVGPGKIDLLEKIRITGSLSQAARDLGMSYRRAWLLLESLRASFQESVAIANVGGARGGGVVVSEFGEALIRSYRELEREVQEAGTRRLQWIIPLARRKTSARRIASRRSIARRVQ